MPQEFASNPYRSDPQPVQTRRQHYLRTIFSAILMAWCFAQTITIFTLPLEEALAAYNKISNPFLTRLTVIFSLALLALILLLLRWEKPSDLLPELSLLSVQIYITALALRSPFVSLSIGFLLIEIALLALILRRRPKQIKLFIFSAYTFCAISLAKFLFNLGFAQNELAESERFRFFKEDQISASINWSQLSLILVILILSVVLLFFLREFGRRTFSAKTKLRFKKKFDKHIGLIVMTSVVILWFCLAEIMILRSWRLQTPTYDMGIFTQMFHGMKQTGLPITSVERDRILSHFAVHFSPILYLLLPIFYLFPSQLTLQMLQLLIVGSSFIPLLRITRKLNLPKSWSLITTALLMVSPQLLGSNLYDFHENCFLAPLILWLIDALLGRKRLQLLLFSLLTLMVKEDAAIYVFCIGLWALFTLPQQSIVSKPAELSERKGWSKRFIFLFLIVLPLIYFPFAISIIRILGGEPMLSRFAHLTAFPEEGLLGILLTLFLHPSPAIANAFTPGKVFYLLFVLAGFAFLPVLQKKAGHYFLLMPMFAINLLPNWIHQHQFAFQYGYGSVALLIFATLLFLYELLPLPRKEPLAESWEMGAGDKPGKRRQLEKMNGILSLALIFSIIFSLSYLLLPRIVSTDRAVEDVRLANDAREVLVEVPRDKKILASSRFVAAMGDIPSLYVVEYHNEMEIDPLVDFLVVDQFRANEKIRDLIFQYREAGYVESSLTGNQVLVLEAP
mgnify:CR=1 FL=1